MTRFPRSLALALLSAACWRSDHAVCSIDAGVARRSIGTPTKILQLVGDLDLETHQPTRTRSATSYGIIGTDLGFSFLHHGKLFFLFGDTIPVVETPQRPKDCDSIAWSDDFTREPNGDLGFDLHFLTEPDAVDPRRQSFQPVRLDGSALGTLELPTTGFSDGDTMYVYFVVKGRSVIATSKDDGKTFTTLVRTPTTKLVNVMPILMPDRTVLMWGRRKTDGIFLAQAPLATIADASSWQFRAGDAWTANESDAKPVIESSCGCNGNFSITRLEGADRWLMLNRCDDLHAITYRSTRTLLGAWSAPNVLFDRVGDGGTCHFMHQGCDPNQRNCCDTNYTQLVYGHWGEHEDAYPYAAFPVGPYTRWDASTRTTTLYFLMSVWNPYSPMLMKATLPDSAFP